MNSHPLNADLVLPRVCGNGGRALNSSNDQIGRVSTGFESLYGRPPSTLARSPGRVNLIGDHTDYNEGWVLPLAIDRYLFLAAGPRSDRMVVARSSAFEEPVELDLDSPVKSGPDWGRYLQGVLWAFDYNAPGLDIFIDGDLPDGAGLSSSAALELAMARTISGLSWDPTEAALLAQRAEAEWVGNECGIMDQLVIARAEPGELLLIDCRNLETHGYRLPDEARVVVLDTRTPRTLATSAYNDRRRACERAARAYEVETLRDLTEDRVVVRPPELSGDDWRRAQHVVAENARVGSAAGALEDGDLAEVGRLMVESHASLRDLYEVSTPRTRPDGGAGHIDGRLSRGSHDRRRVRWKCRGPGRWGASGGRDPRSRESLPGSDGDRAGEPRVHRGRRHRAAARRARAYLTAPLNSPET